MYKKYFTLLQNIRIGARQRMPRLSRQRMPSHSRALFVGAHYLPILDFDYPDTRICKTENTFTFQINQISSRITEKGG